MGKKLTTLEFTKLAAPILALPRKNRDQVEELLREKRLAKEAEKVARYNVARATEEARVEP